MARSGGTYTAPSNSFNPAIEGETIDEAAWNEILDDLEAALTESVYTGGMGATDNRLVRTDGTDTKKVQGTGITVDDSDNVSGVTSIATTTIELGHASDTTLARSGAGDITIEGNAVYRAGGTDVAIADGGTGASTATAAFNALSPLTTQGDVLYHNGTDNVRLAPGVAGQILSTGGPGANPSWISATGTGDLLAANNLSDVANAATAATNLGLGTGNSPQFTAVNIGHASDTTITRTGAGDIAVEGNAIYRAGGTDVPVTDGGTGASTAAAGFRALAEGIGSTQGDILYRNATEWVVLGAGVAGQVLQSGGAGGNPSWTGAGSGDLLAANNLSDVSNASTARLNLGVAPGEPQGRLTLTTGVPVLTSTVSGATTIYYTPAVGRHVPIYDGTRWKMHDIAAELSQATTDNTKSPAAVTTNSNYDLFVWNDSGTYRCTRGPAWTSDTARGTGAGTTELEYVGGLLVNKIAITNGPAAQRGTYVGTVRTNGSSQVDFIVGGTAAGGTAAVLGVWNMYNRADFVADVRDSTDSWSYTTTTWRSSNNSTSMRISFVVGIEEDGFVATFAAAASSSSSAVLQASIGYDSTSAPSGTYQIWAGATIGPSSSTLFRLPGLGFHYVQALERGNTNGVFYGDNGAGTVVATALSMHWSC